MQVQKYYMSIIEKIKANLKTEIEKIKANLLRGGCLNNKSIQM